MSPPEVEALLGRLAAAVPEELDRDGCAGRLRDLARLRSWLAADELRTARQLRALAAQGRAEPVEAALANEGGRSASEAQSTSEREEIAERLSGFEDALAGGEVTAGHLDALAAAARLLAAHPELVVEFAAREDELLGWAAREGVDAFRKRCRRLAKSLIARSDAGADDELARQRARSTVSSRFYAQTGMYHLTAVFDPVRGSVVDRHLHLMLGKLKAQDRENGQEPQSYMALKVDAFVAAITSTGERGPAPAELVVHVDYDTLRGEVTAAGLCETVDGVELPAETVRRLACDAAILPAVMSGEGVVKDMGRAVRSATPGQRARLAAMHTTCVGRGCRVPFSRCEIHHVVSWTAEQGPTDEDNLVPVCSREHHLLHEGGWTLELTAGRVVTWRRPDGTVHWHGPTIDRRDREEHPDDRRAA